MRLTVGMTIPWTTADMPSLVGRRAIVTGANSGLGLETARALAQAGAEVTLAVRDVSKGEQAARSMSGHTEVARLDLADLGSVRAFAAEWSTRHPAGLDLLINNAGIMAIPRRLTADGYETQFATNHLGHFALTGLLLPALIAVPHSRVVTVASSAHRMVKGINFDDLMGSTKYRSWTAYGQSKLANLLFAGELQRKADEHDLTMKSMAAHPGYAATNLQSASPRMRNAKVEMGITNLLNKFVGQSPAMGALPTLYAATYPGLPGDSYIGPNGPVESRGYPKIVGRSAAAQNIAAAQRLWRISEELTGVIYPF